MSVAMTNCGEAGWLSDRTGYRYGAIDPETNRPWPAMPDVFAHLATRAASAAGFTGFAANACLVNRYAPGTRLSLHQDRDEKDFAAPIVSVSLGVSATFLWGGTRRAVRPRRVGLDHGDVVVWGGLARLNFHGIDTVLEGHHALTGSARFNLTFRRARLQR
jgi:alkylated DNA repair protein (DNA oxidative demethylase)